ncbi:MAG: hypothetical protein IIA65_09015, partial [Planctomycetes bacterium]|nr:hypothetical protein [Planctomycetota bacterium]
DGSGSATAAPDNPVAFTEQLLQWTDKTGKVSVTQDTAYPFGPYLESLPDNPLAATGTTVDDVEVTSDTGAMTADGTPLTGWKYSKITGKIISNESTYEDW